MTSPSSLRRRLVLAAAAWTTLAASTSALSAGRRKRRRTTKTAASGTAAPADDRAPDVVTYGGREDVTRFADAVAERRGLDARWIREALARARYLPSVARYIMPPPAGTA